MRYYAHFGHNEFILCLGYQADSIKDYFLSYDEALTNDFVLEKGGKQVTLLTSDIQDWRISFVDTGLHANIGERLQSVEAFLGEDETFLANYADVLTDAHLPTMIDSFAESGATAQMLTVQPNYTFHLVDADDRGVVTGMADVRDADIWINGGYFVFTRDVFAAMRDGEELVREPFERLTDSRKLVAYRHHGFWAPMDTLKDKQLLDELYQSGARPWCVWERQAP
jgi:glucose-1-phosphate cytidylyltransferase